MKTVSKLENECKPCKKRSVGSQTKKPVGWLTTILLIVLPKCPFCLMAYSSTVILCGESGSIAQTPYSTLSSTTLFITSFFCVSVLLSILLNYRDVRTRYALLLAGIGCGFIMYSVLIGGGLPVYYTGVAFVFAGVWMNASLLYVIKKLTGNNKMALKESAR